MITPSSTRASTQSTPTSLQRFPRVRPDEAGFDAAAILPFLADIDKKLNGAGGMHSFILLRHGKVIAEGYWSPYAPELPHTLYSLSKSFTSTAVGLAVSEGLLKTTDKVTSFFPDKLPATVSDHLAAMTVHNLLTMSTGHDVEPDVYPNKDWVLAFLAAPVAHPPGTHFLYNTAATHVLAAIVEKLTAQSLTDYLTPRLFAPLGITNPVWTKAPSGITIGGYGLSLRTEDIAAFGQTYLQKGQWNGKQLIPAAWVDLATSKQVSNGDPATNNDWNQGYGYQFWRSRHNTYRGDGAFGQYCMVFPEQDAVLAVTSGIGDMGMVMQAAWDRLLPAFTPPQAAPLPPNPTLAASTAAALSVLTYPHPPGKESSPLAATLNGKTWRLESNDDKFTALTLTFSPGKLAYALTGTHGTLTATCGFNAWIKGKSPFQTGPRPVTLNTSWSADPVALSYAWTDENTLTVIACFNESPYVLTLTHVFKDGILTLHRRFNVSFGTTERPSLVARP